MKTSLLILSFFFLVEAFGGLNQRLETLIQWQPTRQTTVSGKNVLVAVVDSGVASHIPELKMRLVPGWNFILNNSHTEDDSDHGTSVAGIVMQIAQGARILPVAITKDSASSLEILVRGMIYSAKQGAHVVNVSMSMTEEILQKVRKELGSEQFKKSLFVISSGNWGMPFDVFQENWDNVIIVGATQLNEKADRATYSNYGLSVDIAAPAGDTYDGISTFSSNGKFRLFNGTSAAAPVVAGAAALLKEKYPNLQPAEIKKILLENSCQIEKLKSFVANGRLLNLSFLTGVKPSCL